MYGKGLWHNLSVRPETTPNDKDPSYSTSWSLKQKLAQGKRPYAEKACGTTSQYSLKQPQTMKIPATLQAGVSKISEFSLMLTYNIAHISESTHNAK